MLGTVIFLIDLKLGLRFHALLILTIQSLKCEVCYGTNQPDKTQTNIALNKL